MWVTAILGMATKYSEAVLAIKYRSFTQDGFSGGPMYYLEKGLGKKWLGILFALLTLFAGLGIGNLIQINVAASSLESSPAHIPRWITSTIVSCTVGLVIIGGFKRVGKIAGIIVPFMAIFYFLGCISILIKYYYYIPSAFTLIFQSAFNPLPIATGTFGGILIISIQSGVSRGLFSNEAGLGSALLQQLMLKQTHR